MNLYLFLDPYLIWFFRLTDQAWLNYLLGNLAVAFFALLLGEFTSFLASFLVRRRLTEVAGEARKYQELSLEALKTGDRPAYEAANQLANDAFSKSFFMQLTMGAAFLWPIFFLLAWMGQRFSGIAFPLPGTGYSLSYIGVFIWLYAAVYLLFHRAKHRLLVFRHRQAILDTLANDRLIQS